MSSTRPDDPSNGPPPNAPSPAETDSPRPRRATWITVVGSVIVTLISTGVVVFGAILIIPAKAVEVVEQVSGEKAVASRTVTAVQTLTVRATETVTVTAQTASAEPGATEPGSTASGDTSGDTGSSFVGETLKVADSVAGQGCKPPGGGAYSWYDESVAFAGAEQEFAALLCRIAESKAVVGYLDYTVPDAATKLTSRVGINRNAPNTSARLEFAVLDLDGAVLATKTVGYRQPADIEAAVAGKQRVRLRVKLVESDGKLTSSNHVLAAWTDTRFG